MFRTLRLGRWWLWLGVLWLPLAAAGARLIPQSDTVSSLVLTDDGALWTWGGNTAGELGDGTTSERVKPRAVAFPAGVTRWQTVAAGRRVLALDQRGWLFGWGLSGGTDTNPRTGLQLTPALLSTNRWSAVAAAGVGRSDDFALDSAGDAWRWRFDSQVFTNANAEALPRPPEVRRWTALAGAGGRAWLLGSNGGIYEAGPNDALGEVPPPVPGRRWIAVSADALRGYGQLSDGEWYFWGTATLVSNAAPVRRLQPEPAPIPRPPSVNQWKRVVGGEDFALLLSDDGRLFGLGDNTSSQLAYPEGGRWSVNFGILPRRLFVFGPESLRFSEVAAGASHALAIAGDGRLYTWGSNLSGQLGRALNGHDWRPGLVPGEVPPFTPLTNAFPVLSWAVQQPQAVEPELAGGVGRRASYELRRAGDTGVPVPLQLQLTSPNSLPGIPFSGVRFRVNGQPVGSQLDPFVLAAGETSLRLEVELAFDEFGPLAFTAYLQPTVPSWVDWSGPRLAPLELRYRAPLSLAPTVGIAVAGASGPVTPAGTLPEVEPSALATGAGIVVGAADPDGFITAISLRAEPGAGNLNAAVGLGERRFTRGLPGVTNRQVFFWTNAPAGPWRFVAEARDNAGSVVSGSSAPYRVLPDPARELSLELVTTNEVLLAPATLTASLRWHDPRVTVATSVWELRRDGATVDRTEHVGLAPRRAFVLGEAGTYELRALALTSLGDEALVARTLVVPAARAVPLVTLRTTDGEASEAGLDPGEWTLTRIGGDLSQSLVVQVASANLPAGAVPLPRLGNNPRALPERDFEPVPSLVEIPAGQASVRLSLRPHDDAEPEWNEGVALRLDAQSSAYWILSNAPPAVIVLRDNDTNGLTQVTLAVEPSGPVISTLQPLTLRARATNAITGNVSALELLADGQIFGIGPAQTLRTPLPLGTLRLSARATDGFGAVTESAPLFVEVVPDLRLQARLPQADGTERWQLRPQPEFTALQLETSTNLTDWSFLRAVHATPTNRVVELLLEPASSNRFLRLQPASAGGE